MKKTTKKYQEMKATEAEKHEPTETKAPALHRRPKTKKHGMKLKGAKRHRVAAQETDKPSLKAMERALKITGNGEETKALEKEYRAVKRDYHAIGDALKERHDAVIAVAAGG